jgi:hypothetical protein
VADTLHIGAGFFAALDRYAQAVNLAAQESAERTMVSVQDNLRAAAKRSERWQPLAEHIETWTQDGKYVIGVRNADVMSDAMSAEYGDEKHPPVPLIRSIQFGESV